MTRTTNTGRSGYDTAADRHSHPADPAQAGFTQAAMQTSGISSESSGCSSSRDAVARRAYEIYEQSDRQQGRCDQNWAQAERDLCKQSKGGL